MQKQTRRRQQPSSIWEDFTNYLLGELRDGAKIIGIMLLAIFLFVSMLVGMYQVVIYLFWVFWSVI